MEKYLLDGKEVDAKVLDQARHRFVGVFRPPVCPDTGFINESGKKEYGGVYMCSCGHALWTHEEIFDHWLKGHMDVFQYETI